LGELLLVLQLKQN